MRCGCINTTIPSFSLAFLPVLLVSWPCPSSFLVALWCFMCWLTYSRSGVVDEARMIYFASNGRISIYISNRGYCAAIWRCLVTFFVFIIHAIVGLRTIAGACTCDVVEGCFSIIPWWLVKNKRRFYNIDAVHNNAAAWKTWQLWLIGWYWRWLLLEDVPWLPLLIFVYRGMNVAIGTTWYKGHLYYSYVGCNGISMTLRYIPGYWYIHQIHTTLVGTGFEVRYLPHNSFFEGT